MEYSDSNWAQQQRLIYFDLLRSNQSRESFATSQATLPSFANAHLTKTLSRLFDRFDKGSDRSLEEQQQHKQETVERFSQLLISQSEPSVMPNESDIVNKIHDQLKATGNSDKAFRFGHLYSKLASRTRLSKKWSILYLLSLMSDMPILDHPDIPSLGNTTLSSRGLRNIESDVQPPASRPLDMSHEGSRNTRRRLTRTPIEEDTPIGIDLSPPAVQLAQARESLRNEQPTLDATLYVSEADLLRDLIFLFQGIDGQYIRYDRQLNDHVFVPGIEVSKSTEEMVFKLAEIGWLYSCVRNFIKEHVDSPHIGLVGQSLCAALQHELTEYYKLIAILEAQIEKQIANKHLGLTDQSLTLKRLTVWTLECNQKLRLMSVLVDVCQDQKGGALISMIHNYTKHGDPFIQTYLIDMLRVVSRPFYDMLERWVYEGELDDPYGEFFVACDPTVSEDELWQHKYSLREDMLPSFLSKELAHKIFAIGKSLNFIRYSCHNDLLEEQPMASLAHCVFQYGETQTVEDAIEVAYHITSKALLDLLKTKYKLMDHLKAMKRYLLLGQGDFIQYLMDVLWNHLSKPANTLFRHNLTGILETAVRSSNAQYDDPEVLNRLDVRLLEIQKDDLGWDVFSLDYHVDAPISTVFSPQAMHQYLQIFNFLWRLKRVEYTLSSSWRQWGKTTREFVEFAEIQPDLQYTQLTIQRMIHFIYQLQHYVLFEVLECSWDKLETFIETKSIDLDSIIVAHGNYLQEITEKGFLSSLKHKALASQLNDILNAILKYKNVLDRFLHYVTTESAKAFPIGTSEDVEKVNKLRQQHHEIEDYFTMHVLEFLKMLKSYPDEDLRSLWTRLDYNGFYSTFHEALQHS
ncbi:Spc98 family-domain-containing protein [Choanephora cucurbitarum]|nr:Spc98 family-domain-containing protein [Choanephora cucurbitarum]